jgi:hypothetical protein
VISGVVGTGSLLLLCRSSERVVSSIVILCGYHLVVRSPWSVFVDLNRALLSKSLEHIFFPVRSIITVVKISSCILLILIWRSSC